MESDWRFNVAKWGMVGSGWRLLARLRGTFAGFMLTAFDEGPLEAYYILFPNPDYDPQSWFIYSGGYGPGHFPFGLDVDPD